MDYRILVPLAVLAMVAVSPSHAANECAGTPYRDIGASCADLGLDTNRAVCLPGRRYALMCDDAVGGRVRTCQSDIRCDGRSGHDDGRDYAWQDDGGRRFHDDFPGNFFGGRGDGGVYYRGKWRACETLRFDRRARPVDFCDRGTYNRDCRGRCEGY